MPMIRIIAKLDGWISYSSFLGYPESKLSHLKFLFAAFSSAFMTRDIFFGCHMYNTVIYTEKSYLIDYIYDMPSQYVDGQRLTSSPSSSSDVPSFFKIDVLVSFLVHDVLVPKSHRPVLRRPDMVGRICFGTQITTVESSLH